MKPILASLPRHIFRASLIKIVAWDFRDCLEPVRWHGSQIASNRLWTRADRRTQRGILDEWSIIIFIVMRKWDLQHCPSEALTRKPWQHRDCWDYTPARSDGTLCRQGCQSVETSGITFSSGLHILLVLCTSPSWVDEQPSGGLNGLSGWCQSR